MNRIAQVGIAAFALTGGSFYAIVPAQALRMQECSAKYQAAQKAGSLNGMKWNDFRKAQCSADTGAAPAAAATGATTPQAAPATPMAAAPRSNAPVAPAPKSVSPAVGPATFPNAVSPKFSSESAGKARMHTCLDQYNSNKATNANGGMKWIEKGGG